MSQHNARIPEEIIAPTNPFHVWATVVGTLLLFLAVNLAAKELLRKYEPNRDRVVVRFKWSLASAPYPARDDQATGDREQDRTVDRPEKGQVDLLSHLPSTRGATAAAFDRRIGAQQVDFATYDAPVAGTEYEEHRNQRAGERAYSLVLGDSCGNQGVDPSILDTESGPRWLNLCTHGALLVVDDAWMLEAFIKRHGPPQQVILVHVYDVWQLETNASAFTTVPLPAGYWNKNSPRLALDWRERMLLTVAKHFPLYAFEGSLREIIRSPAVLGRERPVVFESGFMPVYNADSKNVRADAARHLAELKNKSFTISDINREALTRIISLAEKHGIGIYLADGPLWTGLFDEPLFQSYYQHVAAMLDAAADGRPNVHRLFQSAPLFEVEQLTNVDHLTASGAAEYTRMIAQTLGKSNMSSACDVHAAACSEGLSRGRRLEVGKRRDQGRDRLRRVVPAETDSEERLALGNRRRANTGDEETAAAEFVRPQPKSQIFFRRRSNVFAQPMRASSERSIRCRRPIFGNRVDRLHQDQGRTSVPNS